MAETTGIAWADATINFWWGCDKITTACASCYADAWARRLGLKLWGPGSVRKRIKSAIPTAMKVARQARRDPANPIRRAFSNSMADMFEAFSGNTVDERGNILGQGLTDLRDEAFRTIEQCGEWIEWLILTKRPENVRALWSNVLRTDTGTEWGDLLLASPMVRLGSSPCNQETYIRHVIPLLECRDLVGGLFLSCEPLLGRLNLTDPVVMGQTALRRERIADRPFNHWISWVIIGCESIGEHVGRLGEFNTESEWWDNAADVVRQCRSHEIPVFMKQGPVNGKVSHDPAEWPEACRVQEFPPFLKMPQED